MSELLNSNDEIRESVVDALASRKVRKLVGAHCLRYFETTERISDTFFSFDTDRSTFDAYWKEDTGWNKGCRSPTSK